MMTRPILCPRDPEAPLRLSYQQQQLWFLSQLAPANPVYNMGYAMRIRGPLDSGALRQALDAVVNRHEVLRTKIVSPEGTPVPVIARDVPVEWRQVDIRSLPEGLRERQAQKLLKAEGQLPFDLRRASFLRGFLVRLSDAEHIFLHSAPHIAWELRSTPIFYADLAAYYSAFTTGRMPDISPLPLQYADYAAWQRDTLSDRVLEELKEDWRKQLAGAPPRIHLPTDRPHPPLLDSRGARYAVTLPCLAVESVEAFRLRNASTSYRVLCTAFNVLLACYTGQEDLCVGTPVAPTLPTDVESLIGFFAYTAVIRTRLFGGYTFRGLADQVSGTIRAVKRSALPFSLIVEAVKPPRDASRMVLFQVNFRVVKAPLPPLVLPGLEITLPEWVDTDTSKFDLSMELVANGGPGGFIEYRTDLFDEATIARLADDYFELLVGLLAEQDCPLQDVKAVQRLRQRYRRFKPLIPRVNLRRSVPEPA